MLDRPASEQMSPKAIQQLHLFRDGADSVTHDYRVHSNLTVPFTSYLRFQLCYYLSGSTTNAHYFFFSYL